MHPIITPMMARIGEVCVRLSSHIPAKANTTTGPNMRQVVSAISPSNKSTVECFGGAGAPPCESPDVLMYNNSVANFTLIANYA